MNTKRIKVLSIEDNVGDVKLIREMLLQDRNINFDFVHATILSKGLEHLKGNDIDIILLDLCLPDSQGIDTLSTILSLSPKIPIIIQTSLNDKETAIQAVNFGAQDYLIKEQMNAPLLIRSIRYAIERKDMEESIKMKEERFRHLVESVPDIIWEVNEHFIYTYVNSKITNLLNYDVKEVISTKSFFDFTPPEDKQTFAYIVNSFVCRQQSFNGIEVKKQHKDGTILIFEVYGVPFFDKAGKLLGYHGIDHNISVRKQIENDLKKLAITDELTGLYNRKGFYILANQQIRLSNRLQEELIMYYIDVDNMKWVNDNLGHQEGDVMLEETANILRKTFRESDIIARMGGDEFAVLAFENSDKKKEVIINRLGNNLKNYNERTGKNYSLSLSIGSACYDPQSPSSIGDLIVQADQLMYLHKKNKKKPNFTGETKQ